MSDNMRLFLAGLCFLAAAFKIQAADHQHRQLQCWHCASDTIGAKDFCDVTFKEDNIPTDMLKERNISVMRHCNSTINSEHERAVCRKTVEELNGETITKRFCYYTNKSDPLDDCNKESTDKNVRRIFCQDCLTDRCNSATQKVATFMVIMLPVLLAKILFI